jgi:uncharacterized protein YjbI with pentapeptide repeats
MANPEHVAILKQGVEVWNRWRSENERLKPDLSQSKILEGANLSGFNLAEVNLHKSNLYEAQISIADLTGANLSAADVRAAKMQGVSLVGADLNATNLSGAVIMDAMFGHVHIQVPYQIQYRPSTQMSATNFTQARIGGCSFLNVDLSGVLGLDAVTHDRPSSVDISTLFLSQGKIPDGFLRGCGVPDPLIEYQRSVVGRSIDFYSCFISYSTKDQPFADRLYADLQANGVRCWFAPEDLKIGDPFRQRIDEAVRLHDKLLLILSEYSAQSRWVQDEVETGLERERRDQRLVLVPIRIDNAVMDTQQAWAAAIRRTRHIGDFSNWKDHDSYRAGFQRLLKDLKATDLDRSQHE